MALIGFFATLILFGWSVSLAVGTGWFIGIGGFFALSECIRNLMTKKGRAPTIALWAVEILILSAFIWTMLVYARLDSAWMLTGFATPVAALIYRYIRMAGIAQKNSS